MSFATDILNKSRSGNLPKDGRRTKKRNSTYIELAKRSKNASGYDGVLFDKINRKYRAVITENKVRVYVGSFLTPERADMAIRLHKFWMEKGYEDIPRGQNLRNVYYEEVPCGSVPGYTLVGGDPIHTD